MDHTLRCNNLKCRTQLQDRAVVTTCSHIFCVPCSQSLPGLATPNTADRLCPACETQLVNPDDAVVAQLGPTEDYKTSVLSGLHPTIIMECAGRGLAFWCYQTSQEIVYQDFLARSLTDKYSTLSTQMDSVIAQANGEITALNDKLQAMHIEQKNLEQKNHELQEQYRNKAKNAQQLRKLYESLKQQQLAGGLELAAEHEAEDALHVHGQAQRPRAGSGASGGRGQSKLAAWEQQHYGDNSAAAAGRAERTGLQSAKSMSQIPPTPSNHRTRLPTYADNRPSYPSLGGSLHQGTPARPPLRSIDPNAVYGHSDAHGYRGMSAGIKFGRKSNGTVMGSGAGFGRPPNGVGGLTLR